MILSWPTENPACWKPMRLAGTCSRYSARAMPQLTMAAVYQGAVARFFRWPYQASVMNTLEPTSSSTAWNGTGMVESAFMPQLSEGLVWVDEHLLVLDKPAGL